MKMLSLLCTITTAYVVASTPIMTHASSAFIAFLAILVATWYFLSEKKFSSFAKFRPSGSSAAIKSKESNKKLDNNDAIEPLHDFDLRKVEPIHYRPWRTQGHVSMGITKRTRNEWIRMDHGYLDRIKEREPLIKHKPEFTIGTGPLVNPAIEELYEEIMIRHLPQRFPTIFRVSGDVVHNTITGSTYPFSTASLTPERMLSLIGMNVEEDFYFMCPDEVDGEFRLQGYIACFPGGFLSPSRVGQSMQEIHGPVPGYKERLGRSADRYFRRMEPGQFIGRMNWSLQVDGIDLFRVDGNNYYSENEEVIKDNKFHPDFKECYLRVEHQTLNCLPRSRAIMFCVRSYMTPLEQLKNEGEGPELADAIESMPELLGMYKMRQFWGDDVLPWLRQPTPTT